MLKVDFDSNSRESGQVVGERKIEKKKINKQS